jgi:DNA-binding response OmpR family regulator
MPRILIVEDEANLAKGMQFNFDIEGYDVAVVADGVEALKRLTAKGPPSEAFDLVILDVMLPAGTRDAPRTFTSR